MEELNLEEEHHTIHCWRKTWGTQTAGWKVVKKPKKANADHWRFKQWKNWFEKGFQGGEKDGTHLRDAFYLGTPFVIAERGAVALFDKEEYVPFKTAAPQALEDNKMRVPEKLQENPADEIEQEDLAKLRLKLRKVIR